MTNAGGWWGLRGIREADKEATRQYKAEPPTACPYDGFELQIHPDGRRNCPAGDYRWEGGERLT